MESARLVTLPIGELSIYQDTGQPVSHDAASLVEAVTKRIGEKTCSLLELGSGIGIVSIMLKLSLPDMNVTGVEIREDAHRLAIANRKRTGASIDFLHEDIRNFTASAPFDAVVSNPPFIPFGSGRLGPNRERNIARHEIICTMADVLACVDRNLSSEGTAFLLYPLSRMEELEEKAKLVDLHIHDIISLHHDKKGMMIAILKY